MELWVTGKLEKQSCGKFNFFGVCLCCVVYLSYGKCNVGNKVKNNGADWEKSIKEVKVHIGH
jgi:hypothetical protein